MYCGRANESLFWPGSEQVSWKWKLERNAGLDFFLLPHPSLFKIVRAVKLLKEINMEMKSFYFCSLSKSFTKNTGKLSRNGLFLSNKPLKKTDTHTYTYIAVYTSTLIKLNAKWNYRIGMWMNIKSMPNTPFPHSENTKEPEIKTSFSH